MYEGSTFRIFLPRHIATAQEAAAEGELEVPVISGMMTATDQVKRAANAAGADLTGEGTILLVEDEEGLRALNARGLASRGYTVLEAGNGVEAIEVLEKSDKPVDLVVSDVVMPEMDGPTLARELRVRNPGLKIIFVSGYAEDAFQKNLSGARPVRVPAEAVHAQAVGRGREGNAGRVTGLLRRRAVVAGLGGGGRIVVPEVRHVAFRAGAKRQAQHRDGKDPNHDCPPKQHP